MFFKIYTHISNQLQPNNFEFKGSGVSWPNYHLHISCEINHFSNVEKKVMEMTQSMLGI